jgi:aminoglycoside phosphotransferase (APT) family kinase protein
VTTLADRVGAFLAAELPDAEDIEISELRRSGEGTSKENWAFDASWRAGGKPHAHRLLLRRDPTVGVVDSAQDTEFALLQALAPTSVPSPVVHWLDRDGTWLERPSTIVERRAGIAHRGVLRDTDPLRLGPDGRRRLAERLVELLAAVHAVDVGAHGLDRILAPAGADPALEEIARWERELDRVELEPQPMLRFAIRWLRDHAPTPCEHAVLVHGDFRPANVLVRDGDVEALLDWELAHLGDPIDDLGWYCTSIYRQEHFIPGVWDLDDFLDRYTKRTGIAVEPERLRFWCVLSALRLTILALTGVRNFCAGTTTKPAAPVDRLARVVMVEAGELL